MLEVKTLAEHKGIDLSSSLDIECPPLLLDRRRFSFGLLALLDNAIKFTPRRR